MNLHTLGRRAFLKTSLLGAGAALAMPASSYARIVGANERVGVLAVGTNSRGEAVATSFALSPHAEVTWVSDVDRRVFEKTQAALVKKGARAPQTEKDFRRALEKSDVDAVLIATPDHWHAPAAMLALQAGKHVYVEKPCGHNPREGEMLVQAQRKTGKLVQMGTQQRSSPESIEAVREIRDGAIGAVYLAKTWYANKRGPIGEGKPTPVPDWLDFDLWQGPAPRRAYQDNLVHYNWHWFKHWGTGEACNNGTHEIDFSRWALGVDFPVRVSSNGGRYHYRDDWEFADTQILTLDFPEGKTITWEGRSCNGYPVYERGRGALLIGTLGSILIDRDGYIRYGLDNKEVRRVTAKQGTDGLNTVGADAMTDLHVANFLDGVRTGARLNAPIEEGHKSVLLCHLGNIAQDLGRSLTTDPANGRILGDEAAMRLWSREYENGWQPIV